MKAAPDVQARLLDVQEADLVIARLVTRRRSMPEVAAVVSLQTAYAEARDDAVVRRTQAGDLARDLRRAEDDVERVRQRAERDATLMSSGSVTSAKQLQDLEHEIASLARRQSDLEDVELQIMEAVETADAALAAADARRDDLAAQLVRATAARDAAIADLVDQHRAAVAHRTRLASTVPAELLGLYDKIRADRGGVGAAALVQGRCGGCQLQLVATDLEAIHAAPIDEVVRCEDCRRILVRPS